MSEQDNPSTQSERNAGSRTSEQVQRRQGSALDSGRGYTSIADVVVSKIAGIATREVSGVHDLGGGASRAVGQLREIVSGGGTNVSQGVSVEVGERQTAIDIGVVVEYGYSIADLASGIRRNVISAVEKISGLEVSEVNIAVHDIHLDDADEGSGGGEHTTRVD